MNRREEIEAKVMARVEIKHTGFCLNGEPSACHLWTGPTSGDGRGGDYARMSLDGQTVAVHLVMWTNKHGYIPGKKQIDHLCRQRRCVNADHGELVTPKRNAIRREEARRALMVSVALP